MAFSIGDYMGWGANPVYQGLASNKNALMQFGAGLASGNGWGEGFSNGLQGLSRGALADDAYALMEEEKAKEQETLNQTTEWLRQNGHANLLAAVESGAMSPGDAWATALAPPKTNEPTSAVQNYQFLLSQGVDGKTAMERAFGGGGVNVNLGDNGQSFANAPFGQDYRRNPDGTVWIDPATGTGQIINVGGGPQALDAAALANKGDAAAGARDTSTATITNAANLARQAYNSGALTGGSLGNMMANLPESQAAEVRRQVGVLTSNATIQNLNAMRQQSPTGGALGSVTEKEGAMLAAASGAIDPASPNFPQQLDNYERTLLEVVHGPEAGKRIYEQTRASGGSVDDILKQYGVP